MTYDATVLADEPVGYWKLTETEGTTAVDSSASPHNGTYKASPTLGQEGPFGASDKAVKFVAASLQFVEIADAVAIRYGDVFTQEFWIKEPAEITTNVLMGKGTNSGNTRIVTKAVRGFKQSVGEFTRTGNVVSVAIGWTHLVLTKNGSTIAVYLNGVSQSLTNTAQTCAETTAVLTIGRASGTAEYASAILSRVALYKTALSETRVKAHYEAKESGGKTVEGSATLAGTGTLSAVPTRIGIGKASLSGSGALLAASLATHMGKANLSGTGSLSAIGQKTRFGAASLLGTGSLFAKGTQTVMGKATLAALGSLQSGGIRTRFAQALLTGIGTLTANGEAEHKSGGTGQPRRPYGKRYRSHNPPES